MFLPTHRVTPLADTSAADAVKQALPDCNVKKDEEERVAAAARKKTEEERAAAAATAQLFLPPPPPPPMDQVDILLALSGALVGLDELDGWAQQV